MPHIDSHDDISSEGGRWVGKCPKIDEILLDTDGDSTSLRSPMSAYVYGSGMDPITLNIRFRNPENIMMEQLFYNKQSVWMVVKWTAINSPYREIRQDKYNDYRGWGCVLGMHRMKIGSEVIINGWDGRDCQSRKWCCVMVVRGGLCRGRRLYATPIFEATVRSLSSFALFRSNACCRQSSRLLQAWCSGRRCWNNGHKSV